MFISIVKAIVGSIVCTILSIPLIGIAVGLSSPIPIIAGLIVLLAPIAVLVISFVLIYSDCMEKERAKEVVRVKTIEIEKFPKRKTLYMERGNAYVRLGLKSQAIQDYSHAINLDRLDITPLLMRAGVYESLRKYDEAIADCTQILNLQPDNFDIVMLRYGLRFDSGNSQQALSDLDYAIRLNPSNSTAYELKISLCYFPLQNYKEVVKTAYQLNSLSPITDESLLEAWADSLQKSELFIDALAVYKKLVSTPNILAVKEYRYKQEISSIESKLSSMHPTCRAGNLFSEYEFWCLSNHYEPNAPGSSEAWDDYRREQREAARLYNSYDYD